MNDHELRLELDSVLESIRNIGVKIANSNDISPIELEKLSNKLIQLSYDLASINREIIKKSNAN